MTIAFGYCVLCNTFMRSEKRKMHRWVLHRDVSVNNEAFDTLLVENIEKELQLRFTHYNKWLNIWEYQGPYSRDDHVLPKGRLEDMNRVAFWCRRKLKNKRVYFTIQINNQEQL